MRIRDFLVVVALFTFLGLVVGVVALGIMQVIFSILSAMS